MSKSVGNVLDPFALAKHYGIDQIRYYLLREVPFGQDGSYSHEAIINRVNADLANDLGNLAQRSLSMVFKNLGGRLERPSSFSEKDRAMLAMADGMLEKCREAMKDFAIHQAVAAIWDVVAEANRYFAGEEPWALKKTDPVRMAAVLYITAEVVRQVAILAQPIVPDSAARLLDLIEVAPDKRHFADLSVRLADGIVIGQPSGVFPRYVEEERG